MAVGKVIVLTFLILFFAVNSIVASEYRSKCEEKASDFRALYHDKDARELYDLCLPLAKKGDPEAQYQIGSLHTYHRGGIKADEKEAYKWMKLAADQGNSKAYLYMGNSYEQGRVVEKDINRAIYWYKKAIDNGIIGASTLLGSIYHKGRNGLQINGQEAVLNYTRDANAGFVYAVKALIEIYSDGLTGFPPDEEKAQYWKQKLKEIEKRRKIK